MTARRCRSLAPCGLFFVLSALGCGGDAPPVEERTLAGYVTASEGGGVGGASVIFTGDTLYTGRASTDDDGFYELRVETDSPFGQVRATHPDYQAAEATVFFDTSERRIDLVLRR